MNRCARRRAFFSGGHLNSHCAYVARMHVSEQLDDGRYDAFIVWAESREDGLAIECTITTGAHRGDVVSLLARSFAGRDPFDVVGLPCTLVVAGDEIRVDP
jgi:hypothetical protein